MEIIHFFNNYSTSNEPQFEELKTEFWSAQTVFEIKFAQSESVLNTQHRQLQRGNNCQFDRISLLLPLNRTIAKKHSLSLKLFLCKKDFVFAKSSFGTRKYFAIQQSFFSANKCWNTNSIQTTKRTHKRQKRQKRRKKWFEKYTRSNIPLNLPFMSVRRRLNDLMPSFLRNYEKI